jgi:hypothetical protein
MRRSSISLASMIKAYLSLDTQDPHVLVPMAQCDVMEVRSHRFAIYAMTGMS